jgi:stage II sporulation protein GA (sporulation sigma-E factor processing peptidase)
MIVYVDLIFLINLVYDFLILNSVNLVLRRYIKVKRIFFGSLIGSISAFSIFIPLLNNIYVTIILSVIMLIITFGFKDIIYIKNNILYFYLISIIYGGFIYFINLKFNNYYTLQEYYNHKIIVNFIGIIIISPIVYFYYLYLYKNNLINHQNYYELKFSLNEKVKTIKAFYDTGNLVKDPYKGRPVILINEEILYGDIKNKSPIYVPCHMVNNLIMLKCYKPNLLIINNHILNNCLIASWNKSNFYDDINGIISGYMGDKIK